MSGLFVKQFPFTVTYIDIYVCMREYTYHVNGGIKVKSTVTVVSCL